MAKGHGVKASREDTSGLVSYPTLVFCSIVSDYREIAKKKGHSRNREVARDKRKKRGACEKVSSLGDVFRNFNLDGFEVGEFSVMERLVCR